MTYLMLAIQTARLRLVALTSKQLGLYVTLPDQLEQILGVSISREVRTGTVERAIGMKLSKMAQADEKDHAWYTYWLVIVTSQLAGAGLAGFKGIPDSQGEVEIGYGIAPAFQGKGYTTEAVQALIDWAFQAPECKSVIAPHTKKSNVASNRVLAKVGMRPYAETAEDISWRIDKAVAG
jgi:RimJ/RimL family protein N-acetyltransferase